MWGVLSGPQATARTRVRARVRASRRICDWGPARRLRPLPRGATGADRGASRPAAREHRMGAGPHRVTADPRLARL